MSVYIVRAGNGGPVKIGTAKNVDNRLSALLTSRHDNDLILLRVIDGGREIERWFHRHFADRHIRREWFDFDPAMLWIHPPEIAKYGRVGKDPKFTAAIRRRIGRNKMFSHQELSELIGVDGRTVQGWLSDGRLPTFVTYMRLVMLFGDDFKTECMTGLVPEKPAPCYADIVVLQRKLNEVIAILDRLSETQEPPSASITERLSSGAQVIPLKERDRA